MKLINNKFLSIAIIIILLPYIFTVFIRGEGVISTYSQELEQLVLVEVLGEETSVSWEEFLIGILAKEIPQEYALEAMKAQAVIIRTRLEEECGGDVSYVFQDDFYTMEEISIKWSGSESISIYSDLTTAIIETEGLVITYDGELAKTPYHALNIGMTRNGNEVFDSYGYEYLQSVDCPLDVQVDQEVTMFTISYEELGIILCDLLEESSLENLTYEDIEIVSEDEAGYVLSVAVKGYEISGESFRTALALKSSAFSFQEADEGLKITTEGIGHGLGLSQNTAHYMGLEGKTYEEILAYFYPGTEIQEK